MDKLTKINANLDVLSRCCIHHVGGIAGRGTRRVHLRQASIVVVLIPHDRNGIFSVELVRLPFLSHGRTLARIVSRLIWMANGPRRSRLEESPIKRLVKSCPSAGRGPRSRARIGFACCSVSTRSVKPVDEAREGKQELITESQHLDDYYAPLESVEGTWHQVKRCP